MAAVVRDYVVGVGDLTRLPVRLTDHKLGLACLNLFLCCIYHESIV